MNETERYKKFVEYFKELKRLGIPYGLSDLRREAIELDLPIPKIDKNMKLVWK